MSAPAQAAQPLTWGIADDLQADIRFEPNACRGYVMDISLGCPHKCTYCLFSQLELKVHKLQNPGYKGDVLPLKLDKFLERTSFPPAVYLCYSSDPLGNDELKRSTLTILERLFEHDVSVLFISKGVFDADVIALMAQRPELLSVQVGIVSADDERNRCLEPGAPTYRERLANLERLAELDGLHSLVARLDPLLPDVDDTDDNLKRVVADVAARGVSEIVAGYIVLNPRLRTVFARHPIARACVDALSQATPTISGQLLYSIPFEDKLERLRHLRVLCADAGLGLAACGCKDERLKQTELEWICHPFNRARREELRSSGGDFILDVSHLERVSE